MLDRSHSFRASLPFDTMRAKANLGWSLVLLLTLGLVSSAAAQETVPGITDEAQGADIVVSNLDDDPRPEITVMAYHNPDRGNSFRYKVGWNVDQNGQTSNWSSQREIGGVGWEAQGAGLAFANFDSDSRPEMILMAYDNPDGGNTFRYKVGRNVGQNGQANSWSSSIDVGGVGTEAQGAGVEITNLDDDARPEMILLAYDDPGKANNFRYKIGWNLDQNGRTNNWSSSTQVSGVGWEAQGADVEITNLDDNPRPDMLLLAYDNPEKANTFRYKVGLNIDQNGQVSNWSSQKDVKGVGWLGQGAGMASANLDADPRPEHLFLAYDAPSDGGNTFRYRVVENAGSAQPVWLELDRVDGQNWPPGNATRQGTTYTIEEIYDDGGIDLDVHRDQTLGWPWPAAAPYSEAELHALRTLQMNTPPSGDQWHVYGAILSQGSRSNLLGVMFAGITRRGFAVFTDPLGGNAQFMHTYAHELGHALCMYHQFGDGWRSGGPSNGETIMNQTRFLSTNWDLGWSAPSWHHFHKRSRERWQPGSGTSFGQCR